MNFMIREAIEKDYEELNRLVKEVHNLHVKNRPDVYLNSDTPLEYSYFKKLMKDENSKIIVVEDEKNKKLLGYSIVNIMNSKAISIVKDTKYLYIDDIMIESSKKLNGIGKVLFNYIKEVAMVNNIKSIQLNVWSFNHDAIEFYKHMGMKSRNIRMEMDI